jgi:hypothetical protein
VNIPPGAVSASRKTKCAPARQGGSTSALDFAGTLEHQHSGIQAAQKSNSHPLLCKSEAVPLLLLPGKASASAGFMRSHPARCLTSAGAAFTNLLPSSSCCEPHTGSRRVRPDRDGALFFLLHLRFSVRASYLSNVSLLLSTVLKVSAPSAMLRGPECLELIPRGVAPRCPRFDLIATHRAYLSTTLD